MADLAGLYAALPTAFDAALAYDPSGQKALARHAIGLGLDGLFVGGSTAEVHSLTLEERLASLRDVAEAAAGTVRLVAQVGAMREGEVATLAAAAAQSGFDAVASTPPFYAPIGPDERRAYFRRLTAVSPLPVMLYHIPSLTGVLLDHAELLSLLALDGVVGMKLSSDDLALVQKAKQACPDKLVLFGTDALLGLALCAGADGGVGSSYTLFGRQIVAIRNAVQAGDLAEMRRLQAAVNAGIEAVDGAGVFPAIKAALASLGVPAGPTRPPLQMPEGAAAARLLEVLGPLLSPSPVDR